jgi:hypothetical protein
MQEQDAQLQAVGEAFVAEQAKHDVASERVAETVRRALSLVGPSEHGLERLVDEPPVEDPAV